MKGHGKLLGYLMPLIAVALAFSAQSAGEPVISSVEPPSGASDDATDICITGEGFEPAARVSLLNGGVHVVSGFATAGRPTDLVLAGDHAYVTSTGNGTHLERFDLSDLTVPVLVGSIDVDSAVAVAASESHVFVAKYQLQVFGADLSGSPLASIPLQYRAIDMALAGNLLYVLSATQVHVIDVAHPAAPVPLGSSLPWGYYDEIVTDGAYAYVTLGRGMQVVDVRNPGEPTIVGAYWLGSDRARIGSILRAGTRVYLGEYSPPFPQEPDRVHVVNVSNPRAPRLDGLLETDRSARTLASCGEWVCMTGRSRFDPNQPAVRALDFTDPSFPRQVTEFHAPAGVSSLPSIVSSEEHLFVLEYPTAHVTVLDFDETSPTDPVVGSYQPTQSPGQLVVSDARAYWATTVLDLFDLSDPAAPAWAGRFSHEPVFPEREFAVHGNHAYLATTRSGNQHGMLVVNVTDPGLPVAAGFYPTQGPVGAVATAGDHAYVVDSGNLYVVDISDPANPVQTGSHCYDESPGSDTYREIEVGNGHAFVLSRGDVHVFDVADSSNPVPLCEFWWGSSHLEVDSGIAYSVSTGVWWPFLELYDVTSPCSPRFLSDSPFHAPRISASDGLLLAPSGNHVDVFDTSNSGALVTTGVYDLQANVYRAALDGEFLITVGDELQVVRMNPRLEGPTFSTPTEICLTIPAGYPLGPYHVRVVNSGGQSDTLHDGFRIRCAAREFLATLEPVGSHRGGVSWRLKCSGDDSYFDPQPHHAAVLLLPELPSQLTIQREHGDGSGRMGVHLRLSPATDAGVVVLTGDNDAALTALWDRAESTGWWELPRIDSHDYGDVILGLVRRFSANDVVAVGSTSTRGAVPITDLTGPSYPFTYSYEFSPEGDLVAAFARGHGVDIVLEARAIDPQCGEPFTVSVSLAAATRQSGTTPWSGRDRGLRATDR